MSEQEIPEKFYETPAAAIHEYNASVVADFRAHGGALTEGALAGVPTVLLHTVGAKSGEPRINPLLYLDHEGRWYLVGSFGGSPKAPAWVHNLRANASAKIEAGVDGTIQSYDVTARELPAQEHEQVYEALVAAFPVFADYQASTSRVIPLFELVR